MRAMSNFLGVRYFSPTSLVDKWGDASKIDRGLLLKLDDLREYLDTPLIITSGFRPESRGSQHALGLAVDIIAPKFTGDLHDLYLAAERFNFKGLGVYPAWHYNGHTVGGLHLDERLGSTARWMGVLKDGKQQYIALNAKNLKLHGVI